VEAVDEDRVYGRIDYDGAEFTERMLAPNRPTSHGAGRVVMVALTSQRCRRSESTTEGRSVRDVSSTTHLI
jgi:hypothetical protein